MDEAPREPTAVAANYPFTNQRAAYGIFYSREPRPQGQYHPFHQTVGPQLPGHETVRRHHRLLLSQLIQAQARARIN